MKSRLIFGLVSKFVLSISDPNSRGLGPPNRCFRMESIAKHDFSWKSFLLNSGMIFYCFLEALGAVFLICLALKTGLKRILVLSKILSS